MNIRHATPPRSRSPLTSPRPHKPLRRKRLERRQKEQIRLFKKGTRALEKSQALKAYKVLQALQNKGGSASIEQWISAAFHLSNAQENTLSKKCMEQIVENFSAKEIIDSASTYLRNGLVGPALMLAQQACDIFPSMAESTIGDCAFTFSALNAGSANAIYEGTYRPLIDALKDENESTCQAVLNALDHFVSIDFTGEARARISIQHWADLIKEALKSLPETEDEETRSELLKHIKAYEQQTLCRGAL